MDGVDAAETDAEMLWDADEVEVPDVDCWPMFVDDDDRVIGVAVELSVELVPPVTVGFSVVVVIMLVICVVEVVES